MRKFILFGLLTLALTSCSSTKSWSFHSADRQVEIKVVANRAVVLDPYEVSVQIKAYGQDRSFVTEVNNMGLEDHEVIMTWTDEQHGVLSLMDSDNQAQKFFIIATSEGIFIKAE